MLIYILKSKEIDRSVFNLQIDVVCNDSGDPMCWTSKEGIEDYRLSLKNSDNYFIESCEPFFLIKTIAIFNEKSNIDLKLSIHS